MCRGSASASRHRIGPGRRRHAAGSRAPPSRRYETRYGSTSDLERLPGDQPGEHPDQGVPATESVGSIAFNQPHGECQTRIQQKRWCAHCNREVPNSEIVKGYEFEKGRHVVMSEDDFDKVRPESTRVIDLVQFADAAAIDPMYVDRTYYLSPDGAIAADAFAVMRDGMQGKVGIGKLALYGREYLVAVRPHERGIVMHTLHHAAEIRSIDAVEHRNAVPAKVRP